MDYRSGARIAAASSLVLLATDAAALPGAAQPLAAAPDLMTGNPAPLWQGVTSVGVACLVHTSRGVDTGALHDRLCDAVRAQAAEGAPVPVVAAAPGGAALAPGRVTLLVQGHVERVGDVEALALTIRPFRNAADAGQFFGARPRVVAADDAAALDRAVAATLRETLPWLAGAPPRAGGSGAPPRAGG